MRPVPVHVPAELTAAVGSAVLAELLWRRGCKTPEAALAFLEGDDLPAAEMPDLAAGARRLAQAIRAGGQVLVFGDYDADGVTATALMAALLRRLGARALWRVPDRFREGYGLNTAVVEALEPGALLVTVDCGITAVDEVALARSRSVDVIIADHHMLGPAMPDASAVINPRRLAPGHALEHLTGVGVAWLLAGATLLEMGRDPAEADAWLDLVAIGLIADRAPLLGAARTLCRRGLHRLRTSPSPGLRALLAESGMEGPPNEEQVGFQLVPRLNAAGRLGDAGTAVRLLLAADEAEALPLARELDRCNLSRRELTAAILSEAEALVAESGGPGTGVALYRPEWHEGCIGIAAGQLAARYSLPVLLMARKGDGRTVVGSARAPAGYRLPDLIAQASAVLDRWGGHAAAAGFSLSEERVPAFQQAILAAAAAVRWRPPAPPSADLMLPLSAAGPALLSELERAGPFGEGNPAPLLLSGGVQVLSVRPMGGGEEHLRMVVREGDVSFSAIWFGGGAQQVRLAPADLVYRISAQRYRGQETLQLLVHALLPPGEEATEPGREGPELIDRRGEPPERLRKEFAQALVFAEGAAQPPFPAVDRYGVQRAEVLLLLDLPPSVGVLEEVVALAGPGRVVLGWSRHPVRSEERFFPALMRALSEVVDPAGSVRITEQAVRLRELEAVVTGGLEAMEASHLLVILQREGDLWRVRRREGTAGLRESPALQRVRQLLAETRAFRRHFRTAPLAALAAALRL